MPAHHERCDHPPVLSRVGRGRVSIVRREQTGLRPLLCRPAPVWRAGVRSLGMRTRRPRRRGGVKFNSVTGPRCGVTARAGLCRRKRFQPWEVTRSRCSTE